MNYIFKQFTLNFIQVFCYNIKNIQNKFFSFNFASRHYFSIKISFVFQLIAVYNKKNEVFLNDNILNRYQNADQEKKKL